MMTLPLLVVLSVPAQDAAPSPTPADPKLVAVVEQNKAQFEKCIADARKKNPIDDAAEKEKKKIEAKKEQSLQDLRRLVEIEMKAGTALSNRLKEGAVCEAALGELAKSKLKEAGADDAASGAAIDQWLGDWYKAHP